MNTENKIVLVVKTTINAPLEKVWNYWSDPKHIVNWNNASEDWHTPKAENDLRKGGHFSSRMEAKDGSMGFDFSGIYDAVKPHEFIEYHIADGRRVTIQFTEAAGSTTVHESFEAEGTNPPEMQQGGWQSILDNFNKYVESGS